jgi:hypothetical protein
MFHLQKILVGVLSLSQKLKDGSFQIQQVAQGGLCTGQVLASRKPYLSVSAGLSS